MKAIPVCQCAWRALAPFIECRAPLLRHSCTFDVVAGHERRVRTETKFDLIRYVAYADLWVCGASNMLDELRHYVPIEIRSQLF